MGGKLITEILERNIDTTRSINNYILQSNVGTMELRKYLIDNKFEIIDEELVLEDEKYYEIILARKGKQHIVDEIQYEISDILIEKKHPLLKSFLEYKINKVIGIMEEIERKETEKAQEKYIKLKEELGQYEEVLNKIES